MDVLTEDEIKTEAVSYDGSRLLDLADLTYQAGDCPDALYDRVLHLIESCLMWAGCGATHCGEEVLTSEQLTPALHNIVVYLWLNIIHPRMPALVKVRFGAELRTRSLASIKAELSAAMPELLKELEELSKDDQNLLAYDAEGDVKTRGGEDYQGYSDHALHAKDEIGESFNLGGEELSREEQGTLDILDQDSDTDCEASTSVHESSDIVVKDEETSGMDNYQIDKEKPIASTCPKPTKIKRTKHKKKEKMQAAEGGELRRSRRERNVVEEPVEKKEPKPKHKCPVCGTMYAWRTLRWHMNHVHPDHHLPRKKRRPEQEDTVGMIMKKHGKRTYFYLPKFTCEVCNRPFSYISDYKVHMRSHTGEKPYVCHVCGQGFTMSSGLTTHLRRHTGEKPYRCDQCDYASATSSKLKIHMLCQHSGEKPYVCDLCGEAFNRKEPLAFHKMKHTGEKPHTCDVCGAAFVAPDRLRRHQLTHSGEKPHKCALCERAFRWQQQLKKHMETEHVGADQPVLAGASATASLGQDQEGMD